VAAYLEAFRSGRIEVATAPVVPESLATTMSRLEYARVTAGKQRLVRVGLGPATLDLHNTAITRACFERMGGIDRRLPTLGEHDLGARLHQHGVVIARLGENAVRHVSHGPMSAYLRVLWAQGQDRGQLLELRDPGFVTRYFEGDRLVRFRPRMGMLRWPLVAGLAALGVLELAGLHVASAGGLRWVAHRLFAEVSHTTSRLAALTTLGKAIAR
jgi:hypothetical protein